MKYSLFISCPRNMEYLLSDELCSLGLEVNKTSPMGVYLDADLTAIYTICLWSRLANRVQLILFKNKTNNSKELYDICYQYAWSDIFSCDKSIAIEFHGESNFIKNTMYGAQVVKDAIVDYCREYNGQRPNVDKKNPDILLHAHIKSNQLTLSLDLVGYSLHQRGYRIVGGRAPIKENIAAAILIRAKWPALAKKGFHCVDPFCGSGTFLIEAALMATQTAPGLLRDDQAFVHWKHHDQDLWEAIKISAKNKQKDIYNQFFGFDIDDIVLDSAEKNTAAAGMEKHIIFQHQSIKHFKPLPGPGLLIANPPYGERLEDPMALLPAYKSIGKALFTHCQGWQAAVLTSNNKLAQAIGLRTDKQYSFYNGSLEVKLYCYHIDENNALRENSEKRLNTGEQALFNRLTKNKKHLSKWLKRNGTTCYRLYDADIPEYAFAIDIYNDWAYVQEYAAPKTISIKKAERHIEEMLKILPLVLRIPVKNIILKQRKQQKGKQQYEAFGRKKQQLIVAEGPAQFFINLQDYIDTGLFLDYRLLRLKFSSDSRLKNKKFLNCFCYTASVSVHAALAGAVTTNVDLSKTYIHWAEENFLLNKINLNQHQFIQTDCIEWLKNCKEKFDIIFLDPPSFSNSKRMRSTLDIQRDHEALIDDAMRLLKPLGILYFSNNFKKFKLSESIKEKYQIKDITQQTIDEDFKRSKNIHRCYLLGWG